MNDALARLREELRHEPTAKRIRAHSAATSSSRARGRCSSGSRAGSVHVRRSARRHPRGAGVGRPGRAGGPAFIHPGIPFHVHSTAGESLSLSAGGRTLGDAAFRPADPDLDGFVLLDFDALDQWYEEDEPVRAHPRDPYHRLDVRTSSRHVRMAHDGRVVVDTRRPVLVFETNLPTRFYVPREDVVAELLPSELTTYCPYKGEATYWSIAGRRDVAWSYQKPLPDATQLTDLVAFYDDVMDVTVDGVRHGRAAAPTLSSSSTRSCGGS